MAILTDETQRRRSGSTIDTRRAAALFASTLQSSEAPSAGQVRHAVGTTLRRLGTGGCAECLAGEFGDHPEAAAERMTWALATVRSAYAAPRPAPAPVPVPSPRPLALAG